MNARKLRVVPDCPQSETKPQYGFIGGHKLERLPPSPLPHEAAIIARVQSMRTRNGVRAEPLSFEASQTYLRNVERVRRHAVTVPQPLNAGLRGDSAHPPPHAATARAGSFPVDKRELPNMTPEQWDEWERAFGPEPNIPEEC